MGETNQCAVCGSATHALAQLCKRCKTFRDRVDMRGKPDLAARIDALRRAWDGTGFRCYYTGVRLEEMNSHDPRYLTFDHRTPRRENDIVVTAAFLNDMKSDMSEDEFRAVVLQLASRFQGGAFDERVLNLLHWKR
jgi:hypothetical protein